MAEWKKVIVSGSQAELSGIIVTGDANISGNITGSNLKLNALISDGAGETTVLVLDSFGNVKSDEIDSRVWGTSLVDITPALNPGFITFTSDTDTITGTGDFTYDSGSNTLTVTNAIITGDLVVQGSTTELQVTNLNIEDQFILLNSGSLGADTGIVFGGSGTSANAGAALYYDNDVSRLTYVAPTGLGAGIASTATTVDHTTGGFVTIAYDEDTTGQTAVDAVGNIKISGSEAFIYI